MIIIYILAFILLWIFFGIIGFCIETKWVGYTEKNIESAQSEFKYCIICGPFSVALLCSMIIYEKLKDNLVLFLIKKINKEKE